MFFARADDQWILSGANVHISFVGQDDGTDTERELDGRRVAAINADLTSGLDLTVARRLRENRAIAFIADVKGGSFDVDEATAQRLLRSPNPDGRSNRDVVRPWVNGQDITGRPRHRWIIDFGLDMPETEAALYEAPFEYVRAQVKPARDATRRDRYRERWWLHSEAIPGMRKAFDHLRRYIATPELAKHRLFAWLSTDTLPDHQLVVVCRDDDYTFGVLHSRVHELWARATGTQLREVESGFRYTPTTTFETFPFPRPTADQGEAIAVAARRLVELRDGWLDPPGLDEPQLATRTLTNLYNDCPTWLANAHSDLDRAVLDAYGWPDDLSDESILERLLALNLDREPA
jgi:type II restriction/modification system DNA methylase subunit YeeA